MSTINLSGRLIDLSAPSVMGILNCTPDSFYSISRKQTEKEIAERARQIVEQGGSFIDIGGCSTRPGAEFASEEEELERLLFALPIVLKEAPGVALSIDTFRSSIVRKVYDKYGDFIVNDISEGEDKDMFATVASLKLPYILTSQKATLRDMMVTFAEEVQILRDLGQKDIILDPGFGFGKTIPQQYELLKDIDFLKELQLPLLIGVSRKSMIWKHFGTTPAEALNGTSIIHTITLMKKAADILRVHDVKEAVEAVSICSLLA